LDLKAAVWFRRGRLLICSPLFAILGGWGTELPLIPLSEFPRPAQVYAFQQHRQLRTTERNSAFLHLWPDKSPSLQALGEKAQPIAVVPKNLDGVSAPPAKYEDMTREWLLL
jgi:hypothetical protein